MHIYIIAEPDNTIKSRAGGKIVSSKIRKRILSIYIIFTLITLGFVGILVFEGVVNKGGVEAAITLYVGGSGPGNWSKIQDAIDNSTDGDTILVYAGIYYEDIIVNKRLD